MANVKMSPIGLLDMLRFKNMKVQRDKIIESTPVTALVENYASNQNAAARHPISATSQKQPTPFSPRLPRSNRQIAVSTSSVVVRNIRMKNRRLSPSRVAS